MGRLKHKRTGFLKEKTPMAVRSRRIARFSFRPDTKLVEFFMVSDL